MALSLYLQTGGDPIVAGAPINVQQAIQNGVAGLSSNQVPAGANLGGWIMSGLGRPRWRLIPTQFVAAGLSAASALYPRSADPLAQMVNFIDNVKNNDGGHRYRGNRQRDSTMSMSGSGLWCYRLAGVPVEDNRVQSVLRWLADRHNVENPAVSTASYYYALWASAKGFEVSAESMVGIGGEDIGGQYDPAALGYPEEPRGWYFDYAYRLLQLQEADGHGAVQEIVRKGQPMPFWSRAQSRRRLHRPDDDGLAPRTMP